MSLLAVRESGPLASRQVETFLLAQGAAFDLSGDIALNTAHREITAGNPHGTSKADLGLGDVTNDAQLKRAAADFNSFGTAALALTDIILLESSGGAFAKIKATLQALKDLIGGGGGGGSDWELVEARVLSGKLAEEFDVGTDDVIKFEVYDLVSSGATVLTLRMSVDNGVSYLSTHNWSLVGNRSALTSPSGTGNTNAVGIQISGIQNAIQDFIAIELEKIADAGPTRVRKMWNSTRFSATDIAQFRGSGGYSTSGVVNKIKITDFFNLHLMNTGTIKLFKYVGP